MPDDAEAVLDEIGRRRGCLKPGGIVDRNKASTLLLNEIRSGKLGKLSFETVEEWEIKRREAEALRLQQEAEAAQLAAEQKSKG